MGFLNSAMWTDEIETHGEKKQVKYRYMLACGPLIKDPVVTRTSKKNLPKVTFTIKVEDDAGRKQFLNCLAIGNDAVTNFAACLEANDTICCFGIWSEKQYFSRKSEEWKSWAELKVKFFFSDGSLQHMANLRPMKEGEPDEYEGAEFEELPSDPDAGDDGLPF